jgi:TRAP-type mannitol/chloroaromatic compound transport system substrate-binding protein
MMKDRSDSSIILERHGVSRRGLIKQSIAGGLSLTAIGAALARSAHAQKGQYRFRLQSFLGPGWMEWEELLPRYVKRVREASGGAIEISIFPPGALIGTFELLDGVSKGVVEMGYGAQVYWRGIMPFTEWTWGIPFFFQTVDHYDYLWWEGGLTELTREAFAKRNVYFLGPIYSDEWGSTISRAPIRRLSDFKGLKIRSAGIGGEIWKTAGASIVSLPGQELYTGISTGVIDGANWGSPYGMVATKLHEVGKNYLGPSLISSDAEDMFMNLEAHKKLPPEMQASLALATRAFALERYSTSTFASAKAFETMEKAGVKISVLPPEDIQEIRKRTEELLPKLAKDDEYTKRTLKIITETRDLLRRRPASF